MANEMKIANGLILDFDPGAAGGTDTFLMRNTTSGLVTELSSIPASRVSSGGNLTEVTSSVLTITGGTGAVLSGITIQVKLAATGQSGYISSTDWNTFNNKQSTTLTDGQVWIGASGTNIATGRTISGDITISNTGVAAIAANSIVNTDINSSAAIAFSKMAALSTNLVLGSDGSGIVSTITGFTTTIAGHLTNISSDVQAQFTTTNERIVNIATNAIVRTPTAVQTGYAIIWDNSAAEWTLGPVGGGGSITGAGSSTDNAISRWNGTGGTSIQDSGVIIDDTNNITGVATITLGTAGLHLLDTNASHDLIVSVGTDLSADRTLTVTTGDADRTITLSGNPTLSDWFDQSVKAAASPVFADVTLSNAGGLHILDSDDSHDLVLRTTSNLTADRELIFVTGDATRTLTINASGTLYVTGGTDVAVADGGTGLSAIAALSILVANSANTYVALTPAAGQSIRMNAGGTAWEAFTPGGGVSGLTAGRVVVAASATTLTNDAEFTWDATNNALTIGTARIFTISKTLDDLYIGEGAGNFTTTGTGGNVGVGGTSGVGGTLSSITTATGNAAFGQGALTLLTDGQSNTAIGLNAMSSNVNGDFNTALGTSSLLSVTGNNNTGVGYLVADSLSSGADNVIMGYSAAGALTTGSNNVIIGASVDVQSATANGQLSIQNIIFGVGNTATGTSVSTGRIGIGVAAPTARLHLPAGTSTASTAPLKLTTGTALTSAEDGAIEYHSSHLYFTISSTRYQLDQQISGLTAGRIPYAASATTLTDEAALAYDATNNILTVDTVRLLRLDKATDDLYLGASAGNTSSTGSGANTGIGHGTLTSMTTGNSNTAIGRSALASLTDGTNNTAIGDVAGGGITSGDYNIFIGVSTSGTAVTGDRNVLIGSGLILQTDASSGQLSIQNALFGLSNTATGTSLSTGTLGVYVADPTASLDIAASTTAKASLRIRKGVAPTSPNDGDLWYDDAAETFHIRINGVTRTFTVT